MVKEVSYGRVRRVSAGALAVLFGALVMPLAAAATPVTLSDMSSDELLIPAVDMSATLAFSVVGTQLTVDVMNNATGGAGPYAITELAFNASPAVTDLTLVLAQSHSSTGELLWESLTAREADNFGVFDFALRSVRVGNGQNRETGSIEAGLLATFVYDIAGVSVTAADFGAEFSNVMAGGTAATGAGLFNNGTVEAYGADTIASVPEPATALLVSLGIGMLALSGRRRKA